MNQVEQMNIRIPVDLRDWLRSQKEKNRSTVTSEVVRAIRERMERQEAKAA